MEYNLVGETDNDMASGPLRYNRGMVIKRGIRCPVFRGSGKIVSVGRNEWR